MADLQEQYADAIARMQETLQKIDDAVVATYPHPETIFEDNETVTPEMVSKASKIAQLLAEALKLFP